ncbi:MAG: ABC transporter permease [Clostridia bacterium]|nr:ABC transporter permease [Clostridia bacterium]
MIKSVLNKIANNFWLFMCLTVGSLLIAAILSSIPIYTNGALRKMLTNDLNKFVTTDNGYDSPGQMHTEIWFDSEYSGMGIIATIDETDEYMNQVYANSDVIVSESYTTFTVRRLRPTSEMLLARDGNYKIKTMTNIEDHVTIIEGRMFSDKVKDGVLEVIVSSEEFNRNNMVVGQEYSFLIGWLPEEASPIFKVRLVGVYEPNYEDTEYWYDLDSGFNKTFLSSRDGFETLMFSSGNAKFVTEAAWYYNVDLYSIPLSDVQAFIDLIEEIEIHFEENFRQGTYDVSVPITKTIVEYVDNATNLKVTMWILNAPVLVMLAFYIFMVAKLIIEEDKDEITSLKSRGAESKQIFTRYVVECAFIVAASVLLGPPLGYVLAQMIGSANGFLEFVNRSGMSMSIVPESYLYSLAAGALFLIMVLIPAKKATKDTIVQHKAKKARKTKKPFWEKAFLDIILLALSIYLLFMYNRVDIFTSEGSIDLSIYFVSTVFIIACGLLFLRIYPLLLKLIFAIFKKKLPPTLYSSFIQVGRAGGDNRFLILFLVLTISIGVYSSSTARIININAEEVAMYKSGADVVLTPDWQLDSVVEYEAEDGTIVSGTMADMPLKYRNIDVDKYKAIEGVKSIAKVSDPNYVRAMGYFGDEWQRSVRLMAIEPYEFSQTTWLRPSILSEKVHWYEYINQMEKHPTSVLISQGFATEHDLRAGDTMVINLNDLGVEDGAPGSYPIMECYVLAVIDYWPMFYDGAINTDYVGELIVMNLDYLMSVKDTQTYNLWIDLDNDTTSQAFYENMEKAGLLDSVTSIHDRQSDFVREKSDSMVMALNGTFSLGFVATMIISMLGFLLYWILNVRKRRLQFGILRAMGMTKGKLTTMLMWEHLMTSGVAVIVGMFVGLLTTGLFLPVLEKSYESILPLKIQYNIIDSIRIFAIVVVMIILGIVIISQFIRKLKINEAVKIGED